MFRQYIVKIVWDSMTRMLDSVETILLLQPDWLRKRTAEGAMWDEAVLSKTRLVQMP